MTTADKITFHIISHTHWDREWYLPFEVFRLELVELIDNLLDILEQNKNFIFHLDGQSIILEDYLQIKPYKEDQLTKFIKSRNIIIGPWYVLSDQFLSSGEATIRNLKYGIRDCKKFGEPMLVGYLPDQFGQIAQLPQIFKNFNINSAVVGRGIQDSMSEHRWYGLNGDSILAISLTHWYNNAQRLPTNKDDLKKYLEKIYNTQTNTLISNNLLLMNGCDHLFPQSDLLEALKNVETNGKLNIKISNLKDAINEILNSPKINEFPIYYGELRDDNNKYILNGTLSSRVYLKLSNYKIQTKLEKILEPLSSISNFIEKSYYPFDEMKYAWKLLIQNHAHDSICGCSLDEVHSEMESRFLKVDQVVDKLISKKIKSNKNNFIEPSNYLNLTNLTNYERNELIEVDLEIPLGPLAENPSAVPTINKEGIKNINIFKDGKKVEVIIVENKKMEKMIRQKSEVPLLQALQKIKIIFNADLKPFSLSSYEIKPANDELQPETQDLTLEFKNDFYKLTINKNGTLSITGQKFNFENIHFLEIEDDIGDEYNFISKPDSKSIISTDFNWDIKIIENNKFRKIFVLKSLYENTKISIEIVCCKNSHRIDFKTNISNALKNKRVRLHFPTKLLINSITADTPFGIIDRARPPLSWTNCSYTQPLYNFIDHNDEISGLAFFGGGLADYELYKDGNGFVVNLIRAVGKLSTVKSHSLIQTPSAQCNREIEFKYAILPHLANTLNSNVHHESLKYQTQIISSQSISPKDTSSLITFSSDLLLSSLKRSEDSGNMYVLRLFNPSKHTLENCFLNLNFKFKQIIQINLNEEFVDKINLANFKVNPFEIITFGIEI